MYRLGEQYLLKNIVNKVEQNPYYYQERYMKIVHPRKKNKRYTVYKFKGKFKDISKMSGIEEQMKREQEDVTKVKRKDRNMGW